MIDKLVRSLQVENIWRNRCLCVQFALLSALVFMIPGPGRSEELSVPLIIDEPGAAERKGEPATGGIPLPWGKYKDNQAFAVFDGGKQIPAQVLPLVVGPEGDVRWVLVDVQVDVPKGEQKRLELRTATRALAPRSRMRVKKNRGSVAVDTGAIKFMIAADKPFSLFTAVMRGGKHVAGGGEVSYVDTTKDKNDRYVAGPPEKIEVEYQGPMRTTICVRGGFEGDDLNKLGYIARITAWAGRSDVKVKYSLANSNPDHYAYRRIGSSSIRLNLSGRTAKTLLGANEVLAVDGDGWLHAGLRRHHYVHKGIEGHTKGGSNGETVWSGDGPQESSQGWIAAVTSSGSIQAQDLYFHANPARKLAVDDGSLLLRGVARSFTEEAKRDKKDRAIGLPYGEKGRWLFDCSHLSSTYVIDFDAPDSSEELSTAGRGRRAWLHIRAPVSWYSETKGLSVGNFVNQENELKCYDKWGWKYNRDSVPRSGHKRSVSGRRYVGGSDNHYSTEQDITESLLLMYLRSGSRDYLNACQAWANFEMDLQKWRTDGWRWKDGAVYWPRGGPYGSEPQRKKDPVFGKRKMRSKFWNLAKSKQCYCHHYGSGLAGWFCLTGSRDAIEAGIDSVEQNYDRFHREKKFKAGKTGKRFKRSFTRTVRVANAVRMAVPQNEFVRNASDFVSMVFLKRPNADPHGFVPPAKVWKRGNKKEWMLKLGGEEAQKIIEEHGVEIDPKTGELSIPSKNESWFPVQDPQFYHYAPMSTAMENYWRLTGNEDAHDWVIAHGQAFARVAYQPYGNFASYKNVLLVDFPLKGLARDKVTWRLDEDNKWAKGFSLSGYAARFWPDAPARAYAFTGEPLLKERAFKFWEAGSHRHYRDKNVSDLDKVDWWVNVHSQTYEHVRYTALLFYIYSHPRSDVEPPARIEDLQVAVKEDKAALRFTVPNDRGNGKVTRYQVKCSNKPIVGYSKWLELHKNYKEDKVTNWWMATNLEGEKSPGAPGAREQVVVSGVPEGAKYFAVRSYDDSSNRSDVSNVASPR